MTTPEVINLPANYDRAQAVEDLTDLVMRLLLAADRAGLLEEVTTRVDTHLDVLRSLPDG